MISSLQFHNVLEMCMEIEEQAEINQDPQITIRTLYSISPKSNKVFGGRNGGILVFVFVDQ